MKRLLRRLGAAVRLLLALWGAVALLLLSLQFTSWPWKAYKRLSVVHQPSTQEPTHILIMGGSGIPGESGLMRTYYGAQAAALHPDALVWVAMPLDEIQSDSSRAYLDELRMRGVLSERLGILPQGRNTREQALRLAARLGDDAATACVLVVTDPYHVRRSVASLRKAGISNIAAMPAHTLSIEDPMEWRAAELETHSCTAPAEAPAAPLSSREIVGPSLWIRYDLWNQFHYSLIAIREHLAIAYYASHGWLEPAPRP